MANKTIVIEKNQSDWLLKSLDASSDNPTRDRAMLASHSPWLLDRRMPEACL